MDLPRVGFGRPLRGDSIDSMEPEPGGYPRRPVIRTYRSGCGCFPTILALPVIVAIAVIVVFLLTRGDETRSTAACDLFSRSFDPGRETQLTEFELVGVLGDIQGLAESAGSEVRGAAEVLFVASQSQDVSGIIAAAAEMGAACARAGYTR
ncbi:MAG: hypothetical protein OXS35_08070 [Dehalococcoidia bacterium]|nr:hypothetical protein [Dehalococcoidia bacterium]